MKTKILIITIITLLLLALSITVNAETIQNDKSDQNNKDISMANYVGPILEVIEDENGDLAIINIGDETAENVKWTINIECSILLGKNTRIDTIESLAPGESVPIKIGLLIGFGSIRVSIIVEADNAAGLSKPLFTGFLLGIFLIDN